MIYSKPIRMANQMEMGQFGTWVKKLVHGNGGDWESSMGWAKVIPADDAGQINWGK